MSRLTRTAQPHTARVGRVGGQVTHHHDVLPGDVDFEVGGDPRPAAGLGAVAVRLGAHEVHGERRVDAADQVGEEEERPVATPTTTAARAGRGGRRRARRPPPTPGRRSRPPSTAPVDAGVGAGAAAHHRGGGES